MTQVVSMRDDATRWELGQEAGMPVRGVAVLGKG